MRSRSLIALAAAALVGALLSGCVGDPGPVESTPGFASEDEAFAAAEQTYRNYVDALNQVDLSDPQTFEAVYAWTTGELNASDRRGLTSYFADQVKKTGDSAIKLAQRAGHDGESWTLAVCLDVSEVSVTDSSGVSLVDPNRVNVQSLLVRTVLSEESPTGLRADVISGREGDPPCE